jgi:hypothetical protein
VIRIQHQAHTGKMTVARLWSGKLTDGATVGGERISGLFHMMGQQNDKAAEAGPGDVIALGRLEEGSVGTLMTEDGFRKSEDMLWPDLPMPVFALAIHPKNRQDEVKLTTSIAKIIEEDPSISMEHNQDTHQMLLWGQGEIHLRLALERLKSRFHVEVNYFKPQTAYKETIRKGTTQHSRFKRQSGGHGQFGDVHIEIKPLPRGQGFEFVDKIVGGAVPRQYIPSVEVGAKEYLVRGPLGFPVVDLSVTLFDGQYHAVDSSDQAFKTAGRLAMQEGLPACKPVLLEPIYDVVVSVPSDFGRGEVPDSPIGASGPDHRAALAHARRWQFRIALRPPGGADRQAGGPNRRRTQGRTRQQLIPAGIGKEPPSGYFGDILSPSWDFPAISRAKEALSLADQGEKELAAAGIGGNARRCLSETPRLHARCRPWPHRGGGTGLLGGLRRRHGPGAK